MIVLDTSYLISIARGDPDLESKIGLLDEEDVFLTAIAHFEIFRSGAKMGQKKHSFFPNLFSAYEILPFNTESSRRASIIQEKLDKVGLEVNQPVETAPFLFPSVIYFLSARIVHTASITPNGHVPERNPYAEEPIQVSPNRRV